MTTTHKHVVKNTAKAPRGLHDLTGYVELAAGESRALELSAAELASAKATGYFEFDTGTTAEAKSESGTTADDLDTTVSELKKIAAAEGVELEHNANKAAIVTAIRAARAKPASAPAPTGGVDLDAMDDETLRATVQAITGAEAPVDADRAALLALARGES